MGLEQSSVKPAQGSTLCGAFCLISRFCARSRGLRARSPATALLVDADVHGIDLIRQAIRLLEQRGHKVRTEVFAPPQRAHNKEWARFLQQDGITLQPVLRSSNHLREPNDGAILSAMYDLSASGSTQNIALLTSDAGFASAFIDLPSSVASCIVLVPEYRPGVAGQYEQIRGVEVLTLATDKDRGSGMRAILHPDGGGSVQLADAFYKVRDDKIDRVNHLVRNFLQDLGFLCQTDYLSQAIPKFWLANNLGPLVVYPDQISEREVYNILTQPSKLQSWNRYVHPSAFVLPMSSQCQISKTEKRKYGSRLGRSIFRAGGPSLLEDSKELTFQALRRLGYLDDLNSDENEAMFCFVNVSCNTNNLRKLDLLPESSDSAGSVNEKLRTAFLSHASPGRWQVLNKAHGATKHIRQILRKETLLSKSQVGFCDMVEAMKAYVKKYELLPMQTYNGLACQIRNHADKNPDKRFVVGFGPYDCGGKDEKGRCELFQFS